MHRTHLGPTLVLAVAVLAITFALPAKPTLAADSRYEQAAHSGKCLDVAGGGTREGTNVQQWTCNGTGAQQWTPKRLDNQFYLLVNPQSGKCLDIAGGSKENGANVQIWTCNGTDAQVWQRKRVGVPWLYLWINKGSGKCLDVAGWSKENGANVQQWTCHGGANQQWLSHPFIDLPVLPFIDIDIDLPVVRK